MILKELHVNNLRNLKDIKVSANENFNLLAGVNGSGKTSILESISLIATGKSFLTSTIEHVINKKSDKLRVFALLKRDNKEYACGIAKDDNKNTIIRINGETKKRVSDLAGICPIQTITPESIKLLVGGSEERRKYLDYFMFHVEPRFLSLWKQYKKILLQKNSYLKSAGWLDARQLKVWNDKQAEAGEALTRVYLQTLPMLLDKCMLYIEKLCPQLGVSLCFEKGFSEEKSLSTQLGENIEAEKKLKSTSLGPHRADLSVLVNGTKANKVLSRGQLKLLNCAVLIAQANTISDVTGSPPVFLVDDLSSELDLSARKKIYQLISDIGSQAFITGIEKETMLDSLPREKKLNQQYILYEIKEGNITHLGA